VEADRLDMRLEFHQLERRLEHLRVHRPEAQRRLLASLAVNGQQMPIVVVAAGQADRYLVIDGYQRIRALEQLGRDTVEAVVWTLNEPEALLLDRSLRWGEHDTALEEGWLLVELEQRFGYGLEELARRFDRSTSWVSRRMGLVELLPEGVQQQVRSGAIAAHVAMKYLVPVARSQPDDCGRMAEGIARHRLSSREAGQLYATWRTATRVVRDRLLQQPQLFLKTQRQSEAQPPSPVMVELERDLELITAIGRRANRRLCGVTVELDLPQCEQTQAKIRDALKELGRLEAKLPHQSEDKPEQGGEDVESKPTGGDSGVERKKGKQARDSAGVEGEPVDGTRSPAFGQLGGAEPDARGEIRTLPSADPGVTCKLQRQPGASVGGVAGQRGDSELSGADLLLPAPWHRSSPEGGGGTLPLSPRRGASARHVST
jgi:ParB family transcriptional regulator, chromosome partitioning protein